MIAVSCNCFKRQESATVRTYVHLVGAAERRANLSWFEAISSLEIAAREDQLSFPAGPLSKSPSPSANKGIVMVSCDDNSFGTGGHAAREPRSRKSAILQNSGERTIIAVPRTVQDRERKISKSIEQTIGSRRNLAPSIACTPSGALGRGESYARLRRSRIFQNFDEQNIESGRNRAQSSIFRPPTGLAPEQPEEFKNRTSRLMQTSKTICRQGIGAVPVAASQRTRPA